MFTVCYNAYPNAPLGEDHRAPIHMCRETRFAHFATAGAARDFYFECSFPITQLKELMPKEEFPILNEKFIELDNVIINDELNFNEE